VRRELKVLRIVNARWIKVIIGDKRVEVHTGTIAEAQLVNILFQNAIIEIIKEIESLV